MFIKNNTTEELRDAITIFGGEPTENAHRWPCVPGNDTGQSPEITVYTNEACINNGDEDAAAGYGVWYGEDDP